MIDAPIGALIAVNILLFPYGWMPAEGQCLKYKALPKLEYIIDARNKNYLYGKCKGGYLLPDMRHADYKIGDPIWIIRVK